MADKYISGNFTVTDYSKDFLKAHKQEVQQALTACGMAAETYAKEECPVGKSYGGTLKNSLTYKVVGNTMHIGTNVKYAIYVEMGTGAENVEGGTTKESWVYKSELDGKFHRAYPQAARPFLKPSIADHIEKYKKIIKRYLGNGDVL